MLLRPTRPLPRRFRRSVSRSTSDFVRRRHQRHRTYTRQRFTRALRRSQQTARAVMTFFRRWFWIAVMGALALAFAILLFSPVAHVRTVRVHRTDVRVDSERVIRGLRPVMGKHLFFLSSRKVEALVRAAVPDADEVSVTKNYPSELVLTVTLQPLIARLSIDAPAGTPVEAGSGALAAEAKQTSFDYLTQNGLYVSLPFAAGAANLPLLHVVDWAVRPAPSRALLSPGLLQRMQDAEAALQDQFNLRVTGRTVYLRAQEFHLAAARYSLWFDMRSSLQNQLGRYRTFLASVNPAEAKEYIDLRLSDRIIYK